MKILSVTTLLLFICQLAMAQLNPESITIPMRDGQELSAHLYLPNDTDAFPVILIQTPYNKNLFTLGLPLGIGNDLENSPYAFVVLDWRCFYGSIGACTPTFNRGEDGYDAVEWIAEQTWSNGKIGTWGPSALGNIQYETAREQPPHLVCAMPEVAAPQTNYRTTFPGGSFKVEFFETLGFLFGANDIYAQNPYYNLLWQIVENTTMYPGNIEIPMFLVGGWFDHNTEDVLIMMDTLRHASAPSVQSQHKMLMGPWVHGGTGPAAVGTEQQGELSFPEATHRNREMGLQFFDFYLRNIDNGWDELAPYHYFQIGPNTWETATNWPPAPPVDTRYYLHSDLSLQSTAPTGSNEVLSFSYDPTDPSPTIGGKTLNLALLQGPYDQGPEVESREDHLIFSTEVLETPLAIRGKVRVHLEVSVDQVDTDIALRLTDVQPDGRSILIGESIQRLRFREGYAVSDETFLIPGTIYPIELAFEDLAYTFLPGHQLRLILTGSNYPRFNRNMNTGGEMYPNLNVDTLVNPVVAETTISMNTNHQSYIELPTVEETTAAIQPAENTSSLAVFPNPADDWAEIQCQQPMTSLKIFNSAGQIIYQNQKTAKKWGVPTADWPAGLYWIKLTNTEGQEKTARLVVYRD